MKTSYYIKDIRGMVFANVYKNNKNKNYGIYSNIN